MGELHILYSLLGTLWPDVGGCTWAERIYWYADSFHSK